MYLDMTAGSETLLVTTLTTLSSLFPYSLPICSAQSRCHGRFYQMYLSQIPPTFRVCDLCDFELSLRRHYGAPLVYRVGNNEQYPVIPYGENIEFLNVPYVSPKEHHFLLVLVASGAREVGRRMLLREYYRMLGAKSVRFVFITASNPEVNDQVNRENWEFGDVLQMSHVDCYHNLTLTTFGAIQYFSRFPGMADFVMKTDSDCALNMPTILNTLHGFNSSVNYAGFCKYNVTYNTKNPSAKNFVPHSLVRRDTRIREYATGAGYVLRWSLVPRIAIGIRHIRFIAHNEDVNVGKTLIMMDIPCVKLDNWVARYGCNDREECLKYAIIHPDGQGTSLRSYWSFIL